MVDVESAVPKPELQGYNLNTKKTGNLKGI